MSIMRWIEIGLLAIVVAAVGCVGGDWMVWKLRGAPTGTMTVTRMVVAPLKGGREEYYADGQEQESCSESVLPWAGAGACWKIRKSPLVYER